MSLFQKTLAELTERRCRNCQGSGQCDDAEPGDITFRHWKCLICGGSGFMPTTEDNVVVCSYLAKATVAATMMLQFNICDYEVCGHMATKLISTGQAVSKFCEHCAALVVKQGRGTVVGTIEY